VGFATRVRRASGLRCDVKPTASAWISHAGVGSRDHAARPAPEAFADAPQPFRHGRHSHSGRGWLAEG
jgi:hypothetical protein